MSGVRTAWVVAIAAAVIACCGWFAVGASAADCGGFLQPACPPAPPSPDPGGDAGANVSVPPPAPKLFGFNTNLWWQSDRMPALEADKSAQVGAQVIRTTVPWANFDATPGDPVVEPAGAARARLDALYAEAQQNGIKLDLIIDGAPKWASAYANCEPIAFALWPPGCEPVRDGRRLYPTAAHLQDLQRFASALLQRYPGSLIEGWNEPNFDTGPQAVGGAFMGQMQCAVWRAAKAQPQPAFVLSPAFGVFGGESATRQYLRDFYSTGKGCFDALSVHTYNDDRKELGANSPLAIHMRTYRDARTEAGDTTPMWVTEFGFSTSNAKYGVTESTQRDLTRQEYNKLLTMADVQAAFVHTLRDRGACQLSFAPYCTPEPDGGPRDLLGPLPQMGDLDNGYGWLREDWSPKPVFCLFSSLAGTPACPSSSAASRAAVRRAAKAKVLRRRRH